MVRHQAKAYGSKPTCDPAVVVKCPKCKALSQSRRTLFAHINSCGFESYSFRCECCGSAIGGVINPLDDKLIVSLVEPAMNTSSVPTRGKVLH